MLSREQEVQECDATKMIREPQFGSAHYWGHARHPADKKPAFIISQ
ncbi:MAG: hypothetical protein WDN26_11535 [Chitinophagaceae bacterium]